MPRIVATTFSAVAIACLFPLTSNAQRATALLRVDSTKGTAANAALPVDSAKLRLAKDLLRASGTDSLMVSSVETTLELQQEAGVTFPPGFLDAMRRKFRENLPSLLDSLAVAHANRFSADELTQLTAFYKTPIGKRLVTEQKFLQRESTKIGARVGMKITQEVANELGLGM